MIGDRYHDVVGALNNGFRAIGATWGYGTEDELLGAGADCLAATPGELPGLVEFAECGARAVHDGHGRQDRH